MENKSSCIGREHLGLRFTIDYLLFNKGSKVMQEEPGGQSVEQSPHCPLEEQSPHCPLEKKSPHCPLEEPSPHCPLEKKSPHCPLEEPSPHCPLEKKSPHCPLEEQSPHCPLEVPSPHCPLEKKSPHCPLEEQSPHCPLEEPSPHCPLEKKSPDFLAESESMGLGSHEMDQEEDYEEENEDEHKGDEDPEVSPNEKPTQSYIALISMAILASEEKKLLLCDIYQWIMDNYPYFKSKDKKWRNSVRHNLSLNECFMKAGRSDNGKGHFWVIHPSNIQDFSKGDYHSRRARRKIRRVPEQLPSSLDTPYLPLYRPRGAPYLWFPPAHLLSPAHPLSCLSARIYWSWASLPARRHVALHAPVY